jgi:tape measure domain-containing protein
MANNTLRYNVTVDNSQALQEIDELLQYAQDGSLAAKRAANKALGGSIETVLDLEVRVDDRGIKRFQPVYKEILTAYDKIQKEADKLNKTQEGSVTRLRQQLNTAKQVRDGIAKIATSTDEAAGIVRGKLNPAWAAADAEVKRINLSLAQAEGGVLRIAKARFGGFESFLKIGNALTEITFIASSVAQVFQAIDAAIQPLIQREKQIQALKLSLSAFVTDQSNVSGVLSSAKGIALEYGGSLTQIERAYKRLAPAILASGGSLEDVEAVIESLVAKTTQLGLNTEQSGRYIEAFAQVMGKGKLQSEELNQQFSELDGALRSQIALYLETRYGITDLNEAMKKGEVTAGLFREAFIDAASSARDQLAGAIGELNGRIGELNIQQLENIRNTLNTISLESLNETFSGFGESMQVIQNAFAQFFSAITTNLPGIKQLFTELFDGLGATLELVVVGFINGITLILKAVDLLVQGFYRLREIIDGIPGLANLIIGPFETVRQVSEALGGTFRQNFREGTDAILALGDSVNTAKGKFTELQSGVAELTAKFENGKITQQEYKNSLETLYQKATEGSKALLQAYETEQAAVKELQTAINEKFKQEEQLIKAQIDDKKEALSQEKEDLKTVLDALKDSYDQRKQLIDDEKQAIKDRYDAELDSINAQTPAQQEQVRLRKEKLQATINSAKASYEERVAAKASLDTMLQQERSAEVRARKAAELKELEKRAAEEKRQYEEDRKAAEEASLSRQRGIEEAIKELTKTLKTNEQKQAEYNAQLDESVRLNDDIIDSIDDIPGLIAQQVTQAQKARDAYWEQAKAANAVADAIERANRARANTPASAPQRFAGGLVTGGSTYTVNELGREGFLSASGKLSAINAPAWGQWRAPGAGTVIPADIFATIQATSGAGGVSTAVSNTSMAGNSSRLISAIQSMARGDSIQNNVTIQAANTTQAASDMLVSLTKIKRRRYS